MTATVKEQGKTRTHTGGMSSNQPTGIALTPLAFSGVFVLVPVSFQVVDFACLLIRCGMATPLPFVSGCYVAGEGEFFVLQVYFSESSFSHAVRHPWRTAGER